LKSLFILLIEAMPVLVGLPLLTLSLEDFLNLIRSSLETKVDLPPIATGAFLSVLAWGKRERGYYC
jgi:hypothetical protein